MAKNKEQIKRGIKSVKKEIHFWTKAVKSAYYLNPQAIKDRNNDEIAYRLAKRFRENLPELYRKLERHNKLLR